LNRNFKIYCLLCPSQKKFRYNFNRIAGSNVGYKHSEEARAKISESATGENNPNYGNTGANHPFYDKTHTDEARAKMSAAKVGRVSNRALKVYIYTLDKVLVKEFTSLYYTARAHPLTCPHNPPIILLHDGGVTLRVRLVREEGPVKLRQQIG
jgi:group I intron endonuclease